MNKKSKGHILNSVCLTVCGAMMATGLSLFVPGSQTLVTDQEASIVLGGEVGFTISNRNCQASTFCNQTPCVGGSCPAGTEQRTQVNQNYPKVRSKGGPEKGYVLKYYQCYDMQACANPCLTSTTTGIGYCSGPVGPVSPGNELGLASIGPTGDEKSVPREDKGAGGR